ncbi:sensor histidine kinase [Clostridium cochlearium]|uniref:sensor histidine kinase n=1 Tax=Clostridium cochlearium TaxID=1494 RepID=UPI00156DF859|nr:HAMP domain-containing sensor histidine kinase [Clostridium cochlearium]MBV1818124.1 HAMP domain-containing histidine kinase [Bacteroidales bacterium MSK.15.36]MCG4580077.1 HAMP domain-containing histidine kinase [Clostridium cochlearium]NSJ90922.1 HAMP domain-containing histidine kinase [Coprococcus sp. MSK.21.13]
MKIFVDKKINKLFYSVILAMGSFIVLFIVFSTCNIKNKILYLGIFYFFSCVFILISINSYLKKDNEIMEEAIVQIQEYISGNQDMRIECDYEGQIYRLFHEINSLVSILNAHTEKELKSKEFLKEIILDISHQIKTPIAALNIYNGIIQKEAEDSPIIKKFSDLSEKELDRIEILIKNLLTIAKFDTETVTMDKSMENVSEIMFSINNHFSYRSKLENKQLKFSGGDNINLFCDRIWIIEGISNIIKNAFDHTDKGDIIYVEWKELGSIIQIVIKDSGRGIHPEDINYIFKRFYRSRFSKDTQGIGLGLPLTKSVITAHGGTIEVDSELNRGTIFTINFLIATKL